MSMKFAAATAMFVSCIYCLEMAMGDSVLPPHLSWLWYVLAVSVLVQSLVFIVWFDVTIKGDK